MESVLFVRSTAFAFAGRISAQSRSGFFGFTPKGVRTSYVVSLVWVSYRLSVIHSRDERVHYQNTRAAARRLIGDLIQALPAVLLIGVLPGWFWTMTLLRSDDLAERLAFSVALSITLVPTAALLQIYLFETGVTLTVTLVSATLVFLMGLAIYLLLGPAKKGEGRICNPPPPPGFFTLVPLAGALALALAMLLGLAPGEWLMIPIALLVLAAGAAYLWALGGRETPLAGQPEDGSTIAPAARYGLLFLVLLLVLARGYLGPIVNGWPFPRGIDRYEHAVMAGMMMKSGSTQSFMLYPPGFHLLTAMISRLSGFGPLEVFPILAPALPLLCALACYALARRMWGWEYGVAAALTSGLLLGSTYLQFEEARWPNFIGEYFLIVLAVAALIGLYASPGTRGAILLALLGSSTVLYHQIAGYSLAVLLAAISILFVPYLLLKDRRRGVYLLLSFVLLGLLCVFYAWDTYDLPNLVAGMLGNSETGRGGEAVAMAIGTKPANGPGHFLMTLSHPVLWFGLLGLPFMLAGRENVRGTPDILARLTLLVWTLLLFFGSLTSYSGFPDRFERDLGVPLALLAALALVTLLRVPLSLRHVGSGALAAVVLVVALTATLVGAQSVQSLEQASGPSTRLRDRPAPAEVVAAGTWLRQHNHGGSIVSTPYLDYVPSRAMLAMGGYTRMQSYDAARIRRARDLPPFGASPLWDALHILRNPTGERTAHLIEKNDVSYIVFHKDSPDADWHRYALQKDLYKTVFQNDSVIIFAPRG
jgi:hypothetical protein